MSFNTSAKNAAANALAPATMALHAGYPDFVLSLELSGGGYARQAVTYGAAANGLRNLASTVNFTVAAGAMPAWVTLIDGTGSTLALSPNGGNPRPYDLDGTTFFSKAHGYVLNSTVVFYGSLNPPAPLVNGVTYFVTAPTADNFSVSATMSGAAITITGTSVLLGSRVSLIVVDTYGGGGTHSIDSYPIGFI